MKSICYFPNRHASTCRLPILLPVLKVWHDVLAKWIREWAFADCPYWYNEQASVSSFAGAIWNSGGIALQEYATEKERPVAADECFSRIRRGRQDLFFRINDKNFIVEAKQDFSSASLWRRTSIQRLSAKLDLACDEVRDKKCNGARRLGMVFAVPTLPLSVKNVPEDHLEDWLTEVQKIKVSAIAWFFMDKSLYLTREDQGIFPGIVLLVREVPSRTR